MARGQTEASAAVSDIVDRVSSQIIESQNAIANAVNSAGDRVAANISESSPSRSEISQAIAEQQQKVSTAIQGAIQDGARTVKEAEEAVLSIARETNTAAQQIVSDAQVAVNAVAKTVNDVVALGNEDGAVGKMIQDLRKAGGVAYSAFVAPIEEMEPQQRRRAQNWGLTGIAFVAIAAAAIAGTLSRRG